MKPQRLTGKFDQWMLYATDEDGLAIWMTTTFNGGINPSDNYVSVSPEGKERYAKKPVGKKWNLTEDAEILIEERRTTN